MAYDLLEPQRDLDAIIPGASDRVRSVPGATFDVLQVLDARMNAREFCDRDNEDAKREQLAWESLARILLAAGRPHEALGVTEAIYDRLLRGQEALKRRVHKSNPLALTSDSYFALGHHHLARRFFMLALCEDGASRGKKIPKDWGIWPRGLWRFGFAREAIERIGAEARIKYQRRRDLYSFPEAILQDLEEQWSPGPANAVETELNPVSTAYLRFMMRDLGKPKRGRKTTDGEDLERIARYLAGSVPGWRVFHGRMKTASSDHDVVCAADGAALDFRTELGRYLVFECKDWSEKVGFTDFAKFCRVLDSIKARFGVIFAKNGISKGVSGDDNAERERLKLAQYPGIVVAVVTKADLDAVLAGTSFVEILRREYETVRLDLKRAPKEDSRPTSVRRPSRSKGPRRKRRR